MASTEKINDIEDNIEQWYLTTNINNETGCTLWDISADGWIPKEGELIPDEVIEQNPGLEQGDKVIHIFSGYSLEFIKTIYLLREVLDMSDEFVDKMDALITGAYEAGQKSVSK